jgi:hypothetical protein
MVYNKILRDGVKKFDILMLSNDYKVNESDNCIYYKYENNICTVICLYVDTLLVFGSKIHALNYVKLLFINNIDKNDLGEAKAILGIKINRLEKRTFWINLTMLRISYGNIIILKLACTPYDPSVKLFKNT